MPRACEESAFNTSASSIFLILRHFKGHFRRLPLFSRLVPSFRMAELPRAEVSLLLDVEILRKGRNARSFSSELSRLLQNNLCSAVVFLHRAVYFHHASLQLPHIANAFQITWKNYGREGTQPVVFTEIEVVHSSHTLFDTHNSTGYAACLTHVLPGLIKGDALGKNQRRRKQGDQQKRGD